MILKSLISSTLLSEILDTFAIYIQNYNVRGLSLLKACHAHLYQYHSISWFRLFVANSLTYAFIMGLQRFKWKNYTSLPSFPKPNRGHGLRTGDDELQMVLLLLQ